MAIDKEMLLPEKSFTDNMIDRQYIISPLKFLILNTLSFGGYSVWWIYSVWRFLIQKKNSNANAAIRTVFEIVYFIPRSYQILKLAKDKGYTRTYVPVLLFILYFLALLSAMTPPPMFLLGSLSGLFLVQPLMAFNFVLSKSPELDVVVDSKLSVIEIFIVIIGGVLWLLLMIAILSMMFLQGGSGYMQ